MKKYKILSIGVILFASCSIIISCSNNKTELPYDLTLVLPNNNELYMYMPHDDAAEILGPSDEVSQSEMFGSKYTYDELSLKVGYYDDVLISLDILPGSPCYLKSGISSLSKKSDFEEHDFTNSNSPDKFYSIQNGIYTMHSEQPSYPNNFIDNGLQSIVHISGSNYSQADMPDFKGYRITISDFYCEMGLPIRKNNTISSTESTE